MASKLYLGETHSELVRKFNELVDEFKSYLPLSGGTLTGNVLLSNSNAQGSQPNLKWKTINSKTPYVGYCTGSTDGTFMVASIGGTTYTTGLSIGGSSGNLLWKGTQVATKSDIPTALKNPNALKFGSKTYDGSSAQTITASDIGANVTVTQKLTSGTEIGSIKVGSTTTKLYAPTGSVSGNYLPLSGGTMTGDIKLNGTRKIKTESGTSYIEFEGGDSALYLGAYDHITLDSTNIYINGDQGDSCLTLDSYGVTIKADYTQNGNITLSAKQGVISATAPANVSGQEKVTAWFNTANGGRVGFGKEATNSGTGIFFDQVSGTRRLNFRASSTAGEMVWEQPEANSGLYFDVNNVFFRKANNVQFTKLQSAGYLYTDSSGYLKKGTLATQNAAGLMSAADKTKLDGIGANTIKSLSASGTTITYTKGDGTTGTLTTQDKYVKQAHIADNRPVSIALLPDNTDQEINSTVFKNTRLYAVPATGALYATSFYENGTALSSKYALKSSIGNGTATSLYNGLPTAGSNFTVTNISSYRYLIIGIIDNNNNYIVNMLPTNYVKTLNSSSKKICVADDTSYATFWYVSNTSFRLNSIYSYVAKVVVLGVN